MDARSPGRDTEPRPQLDPAEIRIILFGVMLAMFLSALDQTIVAPALPTMGLAFGDVENLPWIVTSYLLTATAVTPLVGKLADIHGPRPVLMGSIGLFVVASLLCALAPNLLMLTAARALQGIGGGGLISLAQTIIGLMIAPRERGRYQSYFAAVFISSSIAGPVLGGFIAEHLHWSLIFWINVPLGIGAAVMSDRALRRLPPHQHPHRLDIAGALLMCLGTVALLLALSWGGTQFPWNSVEILGLLGAAVLLWIAFAVRIRTAVEPLLPPSVLANQIVRTGVVSAAFAIGTMVGLSIVLPLYLEVVLRLSASQSGVALIPLMAGVVVGATTTGRFMGRMTHYKRVPVVTLSCGVVALALLAMMPSGLPLPVILLLLGIGGVGLGPVLPVVTISIQNSVPLPQIGTATAAMNFFRSLGGAVLTAALSAIVIGVAGEAVGHGSMVEILAPGHAADVAALVEAFRWVFAAASLALLLSLVFILMMEERPLRKTVGHVSE